MISAAPVFNTEAAFGLVERFPAKRVPVRVEETRQELWYIACIVSGMLNMLTAPALTLVFLGVVIGLGTAAVWLFWEIEQAASKSIAKPHRNGDRFG
jgi:hypothetical protein